MISTIYKLFKMTRPVNIVIAIITLLVGYTLLQHNPTLPVLILQMLGFATAIGFANIQNDILDLECDKLSHPERPLATGEVSVKAARITCYTLAAITLLCGIGDSVIQNIRFIDIVKDPEHALDFGWMGALILSFPCGSLHCFAHYSLHTTARSSVLQHSRTSQSRSFAQLRYCMPFNISLTFRTTTFLKNTCGPSSPRFHLRFC